MENHSINSTQSETTGRCLTPSDQETPKLSFGIDYLTVSFNFPNDETFKHFLDSMFGSHPYILVEQSVRLSADHFYSHSISSACPIRGGFELPEDGGVRGFLQFSGQFWEVLELRDQIRVIYQCQHFRCSVSRLDLRMDDWSKKLIPKEEMREAAKRGDKSGFKKYGYREESGDGGIEKWCFTFGGRKSECYTRIYNHQWQEKDKNGDYIESDRYEVEFKGGKAREVFKWFGMIQRDYEKTVQEWNDELAEWCSMLIVGQIDFVNKSEKTGERVNKRDCTRLSFWQSFLDLVGEGIKVHSPTKKTSLFKRREWMRRSVAKTLAILREGMGIRRFREELESLIEDGMERLKTKDWMMIQELDLAKT